MSDDRAWSLPHSHNRHRVQSPTAPSPLCDQGRQDHVSRIEAQRTGPKWVSLVRACNSILHQDANPDEPARPRTTTEGTRY